MAGPVRGWCASCASAPGRARSGRESWPRPQPGTIPWSMSLIEWTDKTWNPVVGCSRASRGCDNCYAEALHTKRHQAFLATGNAVAPQYKQPFEKIQMIPERLATPNRTQRPTKFFVNSVSDLFHPQVSVDFIARVFDVMNGCPQHIFQILTKRPERAALIASQLTWSDNIWMGVSVEDAAAMPRVPLLLRIPAKVRWLSCEPLIGPLDDLPLDGIDWVVVGGESGAGSRPVEVGWVRSIRDRCTTAGVPLFFKQWGQARMNPAWKTERLEWEQKMREAEQARLRGENAGKVHVPKGGNLLDGVRHLDYPDLASKTKRMNTIATSEALTTASGQLLAGDFNFDAIEDSAKREAVVEDTQTFVAQRQKGVEVYVEMGKTLLRIKGNLPHGQWQDWLGTYYGRDERSAQNCMAVAEVFGAVKTEIISVLPQTALVRLAARSVPDDIRQSILDRAAGGERPRVEQVEALIRAANGGNLDGAATLDTAKAGGRSARPPRPPTPEQTGRASGSLLPMPSPVESGARQELSDVVSKIFAIKDFSKGALAALRAEVQALDHGDRLVFAACLQEILDATRS